MWHQWELATIETDSLGEGWEGTSPRVMYCVGANVFVCACVGACAWVHEYVYGNARVHGHASCGSHNGGGREGYVASYEALKDICNFVC